VGNSSEPRIEIHFACERAAKSGAAKSGAPAKSKPGKKRVEPEVSDDDFDFDSMSDELQASLVTRSNTIQYMEVPNSVFFEFLKVFG
jgi:hypothetical protein